VLGFVLVLILLANAGMPPFGKTADQLVNEAATNLVSAPVVKVDASFTQAGTRYSMSWAVSRSGDLVATASYKGSKDDVLSVGGKIWIRTDKAFWDNLGRTDAMAQKVLPGHWMVVGPGGSLATPAVPDSKSLRQLLPTGRTDLAKGATQTTDDRQTVKLSDGNGDIYVTAAEPTRLVRLVYGPSYTDRLGISGLDATLSYPKGLRVTAPTAFYDPNDPSTMPGRYSIPNGPDGNPEVIRGRCDVSGCAYTVTVHNDAGTTGSQATATVRLSKQSGGAGDLGSCTVAIPTIGYKQTENVSCTVTGSAWTAFASSGTGVLHWFREADVHNPIWDD
jgi:hypothetical protein